MQQQSRPGLVGLYDPRDERDACGFGLIAQLDDVPSRALVERAINALVRMTHRGAVAADGLSADGCGVLIRRPDAWLRALAHEAGIALGARYAAGLVFVPHGDAGFARVRDAFDAALATTALRAAGWRDVPVDPSACGDSARAVLPRIVQLFVEPDPAARADAAFALALHLARRRAEQRLAGVDGFHVVTLAEHAIGWKGLVLPARLMDLYPDLARAGLASSAVVFHQRYSTNTASRWALAQPFRLLAHNGEINTISGNRNWAQARAHTWRAPGLDLTEFDPVVPTDGSDSQSLDAMLDLLEAGGMDLPKALR